MKSLQQNSALNVTVAGIRHGEPIPERYARCIPNGNAVSHDGPNMRPAILWGGAPYGTQSYVILVIDKDVPASLKTANQPGQTIPENFPRKHFYHWIQIDVPRDITSIPEGESGRVEPGISGRNSFASRGSDGGMGYDGPCPPWNDERLHHYHFMVFALDVPSLGLKENFTGEDIEKAMRGHILAQGEIVGTYTTNRQARRAA